MPRQQTAWRVEACPRCKHTGFVLDAQVRYVPSGPPLPFGVQPKEERVIVHRVACANCKTVAFEGSQATS